MTDFYSDSEYRKSNYYRDGESRWKIYQSEFEFQNVSIFTSFPEEEIINFIEKEFGLGLAVIREPFVFADFRDYDKVWIPTRVFCLA